MPSNDPFGLTPADRERLTADPSPLLALAGVPLRFRHARLSHFAAFPQKAAALAECGTPARDLLLYGDVGTGKSHAAAALLAQWLPQIARYSNADLEPYHVSARWVNWPALVYRCQAAIGNRRPDTADPMVQEVLSPRIVVLDDLAGARRTEWAAELLYVAVNTRLDACLRTVATMNAALGELDPPLASRLSGFHRLHFRGPDFRLTRDGQ